MTDTDTSMVRQQPSTGATRIEIDGDVLMPDAEFCRDYLNNCTRRTANCYDAQGLPYAIVNPTFNGRKMRPVNGGKAWLATRIRRRKPPRMKRPA